MHMSRTLIIFGVIIVVIAGGIYFFFGSGVPAEIVQKTETILPGLYPDTPAAPSPTPSNAPAAQPPAPSTKTGRVVFFLTDSAVGLDTLESIRMSVTEIAVKSGTKGWVTVTTGPREFDLLALYHTSKLETVADINLNEGTYDQLRFKIGKITVVEKGSGGIAHDAKVPSGTMTILTNVVVKKGKSSAVTLDVVASKALHTTGTGTFMFFPVIKIATRSEVVAQSIGQGVSVTGGKSDFDATIGMDETGNSKTDFSFASDAKFDLLGTIIRVTPPGERKSDFQISAQAAIDAAIKSGYLDVTLSVTTTTHADVPVWKVTGLKKLLPATVYIDAATGAIAAKE